MKIAKLARICYSSGPSESTVQTAGRGQVSPRIRLLQTRGSSRSWPFVRAEINDEVASAAGFVANVLGMDVVCFFASALLPSLFLEHSLFLVLPGSRLQGRAWCW
jgi:hypothetical protein